MKKEEKEEEKIRQLKAFLSISGRAGFCFCFVLFLYNAMLFRKNPRLNGPNDIQLSLQSLHACSFHGLWGENENTCNLSVYTICL